MKLTIESTDKIVTLSTGAGDVPARVWEGYTHGSDIPVIVMITRVAVKRDEDTSQFDTELQEHRVPSAEAQAWPMRMIL